MKKIYVVCFMCKKLLVFVLFLSLNLLAEKPNVIIILTDDMGIGDPQCYNPESKIPTPNIDSLCERGARFTDAHTPSSVCTPTRYTLLTGHYCWRTWLPKGVLDGFGPPLIKNDRANIASLLKSQGYKTACIGKWHIGMNWTKKDGSPAGQREKLFRSGTDIDYTKEVTGGPVDVGFDYFYGISASLDMPPYCWMENRKVTAQPTDFLKIEKDFLYMGITDGVQAPGFKYEDVLPELKKRTVKWIQENGDKPFFMYLPLNGPHLPVSPSKPFIGSSKAGLYGDFVVEIDDYVGGVRKALKEKGVLDNTIIIFTSDNGGLWHYWDRVEEDDVKKGRKSKRGEYVRKYGHQSNMKFRGTKADIWEGGHRVPFIVSWPDEIKKGFVTGEAVELSDVIATLSDIINVKIPEGSAEDSFSFKPVLMQSNKTPVRKALVHHSLRGMFSIRMGDWKLVEGRGSGGFSHPRLIEDEKLPGQLYNLKEDPSETKNVYAENPERVKTMKALLDKIRTSGKSKF